MKQTSLVRSALLGWMITFSLLCMPIVCAVAQTSVPYPSGLVNWWPGDGDANDIVGGGNGMLGGGVTFVPGIVGQAFSFHGTTASVSVPDSPSLRLGAADFTIAFWLKTTSTPAVYVPLLWKTSCSGPCRGWAVFQRAADFNYGVQIQVCQNVSTCQEWIIPTPVNDGQWHYVVFSRSGATLKAYKDGQDETLLISSNPPFAADGTNNLPLLFGASTESPLAYIGLLDEIQIFDRALSAAEIQAIYNAVSAEQCTSVALTLTGIVPNTGGTSGTVTLSVRGSGIPTGSTAKLVCSGQPDILGTNNTVTPSCTVLTATFDLTGAMPGPCAVVITTPDGNTVTVSKPFTIEQGGASNVWVDVIGLDKIRGGRSQTYFILYGNQGNVDAGIRNIWISFPQYFDWQLDQTPATVSEISSGDVLLSVQIPQIPSNSVGIIELTLKPPDDPQLAHQRFTVRVSTIRR